MLCLRPVLPGRSDGPPPGNAPPATRADLVISFTLDRQPKCTLYGEVQEFLDFIRSLVVVWAILKASISFKNKKMCSKGHIFQKGVKKGGVFYSIKTVKKVAKYFT
jgi:hypothetical protein